MNKEEILARSKKENIYGDEREKSVRTKRDAFSLLGAYCFRHYYNVH